MKAVLCEALGPIETLRVADVAEPVAGPGEVRVKIKAVGLNFFDTLIVQGKYQVKPPLPFSPGGEFAGVRQDGRRVMGYCGYGALAETIAIDPAKLAAVPGTVSDKTAACLAIAHGTTLYALKDRARLRAGETLAVLGASGGVGLAAIRIGRIMGARVVACASSDEKLAACKALGADALVNYRTDDLKEALKSLTGGKGADVVYDPAGGDLAEPALRATAWGGRYLVIGFASGEIPKLPLNLVLLKGCDVVGVYWGAHTDREPDRHRANLEQLLEWAAAGLLKPHIHKVYPLDRTVEALRSIASREVVGKAVIAL